MTSDQDLLQLVQEKSPEEFTPQEIDLLRRRLPFSPELQVALGENLALQEALSTHYSAVDLSVEKILLRAANKRQVAAGQSVRRLWTLVGLLACLLVVGGVGFLAGPRLWPRLWGDAQLADGNAQDVPPNMTIDKPPVTEDPAMLAAHAQRTDQQVADMQGRDAAGNKTAVSAETPAMAAAGGKPGENRETVVSPETPAPAVVPIVEKPPAPWAAWLAEDALPVSYQEPLFAADLTTMRLDSLQKSRFLDWFEPAPGHGLDLNEHNHQRTRTLQLNGAARLKAPWQADTCLRFAFFDTNELTLTVWSGLEGVQLRWWPHRQPTLWVASRIERKEVGEKLERKAAGSRLLATDGSAWTRLGQGTIDLTWHDGRLQLIKQRVVLLDVPFEKLPDEIDLDGQFRLRGFDYLKVTDVPSHDPLAILATRAGPAANPIVESPRPALLDWQLTADTKGDIQKLEDGTLRLAGNTREQSAQCFTSLPTRGLFDVAVQVRSATRGTGWYLGNARGQPMASVQVYHNRRTGKNVVHLGHPHHSHDEVENDAHHQPVAHLAEHQWLRLIGHSGSVMLFTSPDGVSWSTLPEGFSADFPLEPVSTIGLYCHRGETARSIELEQLIVRPPTAIESIADQSLLARLRNEGPRPNLTPSLNESDWTSQVAANCPESVAPREWWVANAVWTLTQEIPRDLSRRIQSRLLDQLEHLPRPALDRLQVAARLMPLQHVWDEGKARELSSLYGDLAFDTVQGPAWPPTDDALAIWANTPVWTHANLWNALIRRDSKALGEATLLGTPAQQKRTADELLARWDMVHPDQNPPYPVEMTAKRMKWLQALAANSDDAPVMPRSWRHPLLLQLSKEGYNASAELQAALDGEAFLDGCRVIANLVATDQGELLPVATDPHLFVSLPAAVERVMKQYPPLLAAMRDQMGAAGDVRVRQAIADGNVSAIEAVTLQFSQTAAAAHAHLWLGDRSLAAGNWLDAIEHFSMASRIPDSSLEDPLQLRRWLMGLPLPAGFDPQSVLGRTRDAFTPQASLEALSQTRDYLQQNVWQPQNATSPPVTMHPVPAPLYWETRQILDFNPPAGRDADRSEYRSGDLWSRQMSTTAVDSLLVAHNRLQTRAFDRTTFAEKWKSEISGEHGSAQAYSHLTFHPVRHGDQLFVRRIGKEGVELAALELATGQTRWTYRGGTGNGESDRASVLTDPWPQFSNLGVIVERPIESEVVSIEWHLLDAATGELLESVPLFRIRDVLPGQFSVTSTIADRRLWITAPGLTACLSHRGDILWLRRHTWIPRTIDSREFNKILAPPARVGDLLLVEPPGTNGVIALDADTGEFRWAVPVDGFIGRAGISNNLWIGRSTTGLLAVDVYTGAIRWQTPLADLLDGAAIDDQRLLVTRRKKDSRGKRQIEAVWLDRETGFATHRSPIDSPEGDDSQLGQLFTIDSKSFGWFGQGHKNPRDLKELLPISEEGQSTPPPESDPGRDVFTKK
ncbi:MAG: hypothetical protein C0478_05525 [Planctomyces sp.]|nr:hypothetical protein [Planctomyces sp.]